MLHQLWGAPTVVASALTQAQQAESGVIREALFYASLTFIVTWVIGRPTIDRLNKMGIGKKIRIDGPSTHMIKQGTPTMGGIMVVLGVFLVNAVFNSVGQGRGSILLPLLVVVSSGVLGAVDDLLNIAGGKNSGITARFKFSWLLLFAASAALVLWWPTGFFQLDSINIPFAGKHPLGAWYVPIAIFWIVGFSNAVNLTDGLDTLVGGLLALAFAAYGIIAFLQGQPFLVTLCFTTVGALLGFLWYNSHPAQVFMGDTGSLSLGALLAVVSLMTGQWLLLPVVGSVFVAVALSVILQVAYFKLTRGKRLFKMAPLHHHFELLGWAETQIAMRFWLVGMVAAMVGVALALS
jgi:phospho-N-acetylmuramoyl-pentapeptide-transferase